MARHWNLPEFICDAIRYHHDMSSIGLHASRTMVAILQLAIEIFYREHVKNTEWDRVKEDVLIELGLRDDALPEFIDDILEAFHAQECGA